MITEKYISTPQIKKLHVLFNQLGLISRKAEIICDFSHARTTHCNELTRVEAAYLIKMLQDKADALAAKKHQSAQPKTDCKTELINQIYQAAWDFGIIYGETSEDKAINQYLIDKFCLERGTVKKELAEMTYVELKKTLQQLNAINRYKKSKQINNYNNK